MRRAIRLLTSVSLAYVALIAGACGEGSGTTGERITLEVRISASDDSRSFVNAKGWRVEVGEARVGIGALYFYDGDTIFARGPSLVRSAHAHPGHYVPGTARGELLSASSADLLAGTTRLGIGDGITGPVRSGTFSFASSEPGASVIVLDGTATKDVEVRRFRAEIGLSEMNDASGAPQIEGCQFTEADMKSDGVVAITIGLPLWFDQVDFTAVPKSADGAPVTLPDGLARNQLLRGTRAGIAYRFTYSAAAP